MKKIEDLINQRIITKGQLCKEIGISRPTLDYILKGEKKSSLLTIKAICKYFNVDWKDYVED